MREKADSSVPSNGDPLKFGVRARRARRRVAAFLATVLAATVAFLSLLVARSERGAGPAFRVQSRSMEPSWRGPWFETTCPECGASVVMSVDVASSSANSERGAAESPEVREFRDKVRVMTCRRCGSVRASAAAAVFHDGELAQATRVGAKKLERWRVAIFRDPSGACSIKRIVGLPGERVAIRNGDVWIDGRVARRTFEQFKELATEVSPTFETRADDRVYATSVVVSRRVGSDGLERLEPIPTAISNESPISSFNGGASSPTEFVRDFAIRFQWNADGAGGERLAVLARRPERAWLIEYSALEGAVSARSTPLRDGRAESGRAFEELTLDDFADSKASRAPTPKVAWRGAVEVIVAAIDGELTVSGAGRELARFDLGDVGSSATAAIATPFAILGAASRASEPALFRDVHYSSTDEGERTVPPGQYYVLGDNSPASRDSRFPDVGTLPVESVIGVATRCEESREGR